MNYTQQVLATHPRQTEVNLEVLMTCLRACVDCAQSCAMCADACLSEKEVESLLVCIRLNFDCAEVCLTTGKLLSGLSQVNMALWRSQLQTCITACQMCGGECAQHATHHEHCRICAQACRRCEEACHELLAVLSQIQEAR